jgi:hypothetical protein
VLWPPDVPHGAWADHGHMRAIVVELSAGDVLPAALIEGGRPVLSAGGSPVSRGEGSLRGPGPEPLADPDAGEPH